MEPTANLGGFSTPMAFERKNDHEINVGIARRRTAGVGTEENDLAGMKLRSDSVAIGSDCLEINHGFPHSPWSFSQAG